MQLFQIEYFLAVAETLNFTRAAQKLCVSQPSVSRQIRLLEQEFGFPLLLRSNRSVQLTPEGQIIYDGFRRACGILDETLERAKTSAQAFRGRLVVGCVDELNTKLFLPDLMMQLNTLYRDRIHVSLKRCNFNELRAGLLDRTFDLIFTLAFSLEPAENMARRSILRTDTYAVISKAHPLAAQPSLTFPQLREAPLVVISREESPAGYAHALALCESCGFHPPAILEASSFETQFLYVESGLGFSLLDAAIQSFNSPKLRCIPLNRPQACTTVDAVWMSDNDNPALGKCTALLAEKTV